MTENVTGYNWILEIGGAVGASLPPVGSESWTRVLDIESLTPPSPSRETQEWNVLDLAASKKIPGAITFEPLAMTITRAYDEEAHDRMEDDAASGAPRRRNFRLRVPNNAAEIRTWQGYVTKFAIGEVTNQGRVTVEVEIAVDGSVVVSR